LRSEIVHRRAQRRRLDSMPSSYQLDEDKSHHVLIPACHQTLFNFGDVRRESVFGLFGWVVDLGHLCARHHAGNVRRFQAVSSGGVAFNDPGQPRRASTENGSHLADVREGCQQTYYSKHRLRESSQTLVGSSDETPCRFWRERVLTKSKHPPSAAEGRHRHCQAAPSIRVLRQFQDNSAARSLIL
jgi:hypothetical protein